MLPPFKEQPLDETMETSLPLYYHDNKGRLIHVQIIPPHKNACSTQLGHRLDTYIKDGVIKTYATRLSKDPLRNRDDLEIWNLSGHLVSVEEEENT